MSGSIYGPIALWEKLPEWFLGIVVPKAEDPGSRSITSCSPICSWTCLANHTEESYGGGQGLSRGQWHGRQGGHGVN